MPHPVKIRAQIVRGFGRGSKLLGFPTANLDPQAFTQILADNSVKHGVYAGWIHIHPQKEVYKTVLSVGLNPTFHDSVHPTVECYILHRFDSDFYGSTVSLIIGGYIRESVKYGSMDELMEAIKSDEIWGNDMLHTEPQLRKLRDDPFLHEDVDSSMNGNVNESNG